MTVEITAQQVKQLRDRTSAGMMDCKKALVECGGNIEQAIDWLRKKGLSAAAKKASRITSEGLVGVRVSGNKGTVVEINAETDFVARNEMFRSYVENIVCLANENNCDVDGVANLPYPDSDKTVSEELTNLIAIIGENMSIRRIAHLYVQNGVVASYVHNKVADNLGQIGVIVAIESDADKAKLLEFGKKIAMHITAANPLSVCTDCLDPTVIEREKAVVMEQAKTTGKDPKFLDKIIEGRIRKFYEEVVLLEQKYIMDDSLKVKDVITNLEKELCASIKITGFVKYILGEGIEKQTVDFASEVAAQLS